MIRYTPLLLCVALVGCQNLSPKPPQDCVFFVDTSTATTLLTPEASIEARITHDAEILDRLDSVRGEVEQLRNDWAGSDEWSRYTNVVSLYQAELERALLQLYIQRRLKEMN